MEPGQAIAVLQAHEADLKQLGVEALYLFGSTARGQAQADSDVDLFVDYVPGRFDLFDLMELRERTAAILGQRVDVTTRDSLHKSLRAKIEAGALRVF